MYHFICGQSSSTWNDHIKIYFFKGLLYFFFFFLFVQKFVHLLKDPVASRRLWLMNTLEIPWTIHMKGRWKGAGLQDRWCYRVVMVGPSVNLHMWHCIRKWWLHVVNVSPKKSWKERSWFFSSCIFTVSHQPVSSTFSTVQQCLQDKRGPKKYTELQIMQWLFTWIPFLNCSQ